MVGLIALVMIPDPTRRTKCNACTFAPGLSGPNGLTPCNIKGTALSPHQCARAALAQAQEDETAGATDAVTLFLRPIVSTAAWCPCDMVARCPTRHGRLRDLSFLDRHRPPFFSVLPCPRCNFLRCVATGCSPWRFVVPVATRRLTTACRTALHVVASAASVVAGRGERGRGRGAGGLCRETRTRCHRLNRALSLQWHSVCLFGYHRCPR